MTLRQRLEQRGVTLEPKLTFTSAAPLDAETLALLREHKAELLLELIESAGKTTETTENLPRLPRQLESLLRAASSDLLPKDTVTLPAGLVSDLNSYTLAWAASYLTGDRDEALRRLWQAHRVWKVTN